MRKLVVQINISLDGFADHTVAIADDELHDFFTDLLNDVEIALFGRVTYQLMEGYWPHARTDPDATPGMIRFADKFNAMPKVVFSNTLQNADWNNTRLVRGDAVAEVRKLKTQSGGSLSLGGIGIIQEFMKLGLIDEYWILIHPVLAGKGRRLFDGSYDPGTLRLVDTKTFTSGVVVLHYSS